MRVPSLGRGDHLEEGMATHSSIPRESHGQRSLEGFIPWGRKSRTRPKGLNTHARDRTMTAKRLKDKWMIKYLRINKAQIFKTGTRAGHAPKLEIFGKSLRYRRAQDSRTPIPPPSLVSSEAVSGTKQRCFLTQNLTGTNKK